jgi:hypothetical protein
MSEHDKDDELRALWRAQKVEGPLMTLENVMRQDTKFDRTIKWRNAREYVVGVPAVVLFVCMGFFMPPIYGLTARAGALVCAAGIVVVLARLRSHGTAAPAPAAEAPTREHVAHYRAELVRQRDLLASVPRWYLGPLVPGMVLLVVGVALDALARGMPMGTVAARLMEPVGIIVGMFGVIAVANHVVAKRLTREIAALDAA